MTIQIRELLIVDGKRLEMETFPPLPWDRLKGEERVAMPDEVLFELPDGQKLHASDCFFRPRVGAAIKASGKSAMNACGLWE